MSASSAGKSTNLDEDDVVFGGDTRKQPSDYIPCRCNRMVVVIVLVLVVCVIVATSVALAVSLSSGSSSTVTKRPVVSESCNILPNRRFDCFPSAPGAEMEANEENCKQRGCCWSPQKSAAVKCYYPGGPRQVHLALTGNPSEMLVTWLKLGAAKESDNDAFVEYGKSSRQYSKNSTLVQSVSYRQSPHKIFRCILQDLEPNTTYYYRVGWKGSKSEELMFVSAPVKGQGPNEVIVYGDMGYYDQGAKTGNLVIQYMKTVRSPLVLHVGDISYADFRGQSDIAKDSILWDLFFHRIEPIANRAPYMVSAGNHDIAKNVDTGMQCGVGYIYQFKMPSQNDTVDSDTNCETSYATRVWYSFDYGLAHWAAISTEHDFSQGSEQYQWLEQDLIAANSSRDTVPFVFVHGHRPMYCSHGRPDCEVFAPRLQASIEPLLVKYHVDMAIWGHVHAYERTYPVVNFTRVSSNVGTVHLVVGMAGADFWSIFDKAQPKWSVYREQAYGYSRIHIVNRTAARIEFIVDAEGTVNDSFWITR